MDRGAQNSAAYRTSDHLRWQQMDFVVGIEVLLSNNHTVLLQPGETTDDKTQLRADGTPKANAVRRLVDICDELAGRYPKDFKFVGWHPHCRCHAVAILKTEDEMAEDARRILSGEPPQNSSVNTVRDVPASFKDWVNEHAERISVGGKLPYFLRDNQKRVSDILDMSDNPNVALKIKVGDREWTLKGLIDECTIIKTENGKVYVHPTHGKFEKKENLEFAKWRAEQFGEEVILLPKPHAGKVADSYNITRGVTEEYKRANEPTKNAIDQLIRSGKKQADYLIIEPHENMPVRDLVNAITSRVHDGPPPRCADLKEIRLKIGDSEAVYTRSQIVSPTFKIKPEDFHNVSASRSQGLRPTSEWAGTSTDAKVAKFFGLNNKTPSELAKALGIEQGEPMSFEEANEMRGNPNYKKGVKYRVNCQCSVLANEMRRRGFDVEAFGNTKEDWYMPSVLAKKPEIAFLDTNGQPPVAIGVKFNGDLLSSLQNEMKEPGRYHLRFRFQNDGGHIITAERLPDGSLRIYDPQNGKIIKTFSEYSTGVKTDSFEYYRVDDLQINADVAKGTVKLVKSKGDAPRMQLPQITEFLERGWYGEIKADVAEYVKARNAAKTYREKVAFDVDMVKNGEFIMSEYHSTAKGAIYATEELPKKIDRSNQELSKNIQMARKMANNGYDVYLLSNPRSGKSADFIFSKGGKMYYTEGKLSTGKNSLGHNLAKGSTQSERILVDLTGTNDTNYITARLEEAFENNSNLKEVMLLKGGRLISITTRTMERKDFKQYFRKVWEQKK